MTGAPGLADPEWQLRRFPDAPLIDWPALNWTALMHSARKRHAVVLSVDRCASCISAHLSCFLLAQYRLPCIRARAIGCAILYLAKAEIDLA
jgi:hypothetical protein